jgi:hypothetical protein
MFDQVMVIKIEFRPVRWRINCKLYGVRLANPPKPFVVRESLANDVKSPLVPSKEASDKLMRLRTSMGVASLNFP